MEKNSEPGKYQFRLKQVYDSRRRMTACDSLWTASGRVAWRKKRCTRRAGLRMSRPVSPLRKWFGHEPAKRIEFQRRYRVELEKNPPAWQPLLTASQNDNVTLLFAARDMNINHAAVLKEFLEEKSNRKKQL